MPTDLIATTSELSSRTQQFGVAAESRTQDAGSTARTGTLRIEIAVAIEIATSGFGVSLAGSIALRVSGG
jgi:hypothetical protein